MNYLKGEKIFLRPVEISDLETLYEWENDPETWEVSETVNPFSRFFLEQYILNSQNNIYTDKQLRLMVQKNHGETVGSVDLFDFDAHNRRCGIGIITGKKYRQKGFASEAIDLLINYCRKGLNLHQLFCNINKNNVDSIRLFQKKGFEISGVKKQWVLRENQWLDEYFLQLIIE